MMTAMALSSAARLLAMSPQDGDILGAISGIFGSISLVAWIFVILPQLVTNYRAKSADGISMAFLIVWMLGDITNLIGALLTHLAPTAVALAGYFCFADCALISQCVYYNTINSRRAAAARSQNSQMTTQDEQSPLLVRQEGVSDSSRKNSMVAEDPMTTRPWLYNTSALLGVHLIGFCGWFISYKAGAWNSSVPNTTVVALDEDRTLPELIGLGMGYISALFYLCARIPQIIKNHREKSCEGLSLLFFLLSLTGNGTYGISLLAYSQDKKYLINSIPWLLGSVGTMVEDSIIFIQFHLYGENERMSASVA